MVLFRRSESGKKVDQEWHQFRQNAREGAMDIKEFSDSEQLRYNLDTAGITGQDNPRTYTFRRAVDIFGVNGVDVRELRNR
jgi:cysteinyl-tRNA synthetase